MYVLGCKYGRNGASMLIDVYVPPLNSPSHVPSLILGSCKEGIDCVGLGAGEWRVIRSDIVCDTRLKEKTTVGCRGGAGTAEERWVDVDWGWLSLC